MKTMYWRLLKVLQLAVSSVESSWLSSSSFSTVLFVEGISSVALSPVCTVLCSVLIGIAVDCRGTALVVVVVDSKCGAFNASSQWDPVPVRAHDFKLPSSRCCAIFLEHKEFIMRYEWFYNAIPLLCTRITVSVAMPFPSGHGHNFILHFHILVNFCCNFDFMVQGGHITASLFDRRFCAFAESVNFSKQFCLCRNIFVLESKLELMNG